MKQIIKIALVDDHKVMRSALANYLKGVPGFKVLFDVGTLSDMQSRLNWDDKPDVLLMDYSMKNEKGPDGIIYIRETLGDEMSIPPTSTYLAGNISASHTCLDQADCSMHI